MIESLAFAAVLLVAVWLADRQVTRLLAPRIDTRFDERLTALEETVRKVQMTANSTAVSVGLSPDGSISRKRAI